MDNLMKIWTVGGVIGIIIGAIIGFSSAGIGGAIVVGIIIGAIVGFVGSAILINEMTILIAVVAGVVGGIVFIIYALWNVGKPGLLQKTRHILIYPPITA